jgi:anthranilate synthase component II
MYFCEAKFGFMHILLIDNYDSFTYNLVQLLRESGLDHRLTIVPNTIQINQLPGNIDKVLISPGPGLPGESGNLMLLVAHLASKLPMLGICLGHQALALHFGCRLKHTAHSFHGFASQTIKSGAADYLLAGLPIRFACGRYHSWLIDPESLQPEIAVIATDDQGHIMAFRHLEYDVRGLQFHPESYMTAHGQQIINNWLAEK